VEWNAALRWQFKSEGMTGATEIDRPPKAAVQAMAPLLSVRNIEVVYDDVILVLRGLSLEVPQGAIVALLGATARASRRR
jgi:branched-chain amino acid transport system ATP-binding protein